MTKQEFEQRYGRPVVNDEYAKVEGLYLSCDLDKDEFVKEFKEHDLGTSKVVADMYQELIRYRNKALNLQNDIEKTADMLISDAEKSYDADWFYHRASEILGRKEVIKRKIEKGIELCPDDLEYIKDFVL